MTTGKLSALCWTVFSVMSLAFLPLLLLIGTMHSLPLAARVILGALVVGGLWWGPFGYAMYLALAVMRNGDRRLLTRGAPGTAVVLAAQRTNTIIQNGEFEWEAPRVYKYRLRVSLPGRPDYETDCRICADGIREGQTVHVAVSRHNRKRVTIDVGQGGKGGKAAAGARNSGRAVPVPGRASDLEREQLEPEQARLDALARLGTLHSSGVLTDAEFAAEKARLLRD